MNEYLVELYGWLDTNYAYSGRYTFDDFQNNMQEEDFSLEMYSWLTGVDKTFTEREPLDIWSDKVKVKKKSIYKKSFLLGFRKLWNQNRTMAIRILQN